MRQKALVTTLLVTIGLLLGGASGAMAAPLSWSGPQAIDHAPPFGELAGLTGMACPSSTLCVAVDNFGNVLTSTDPTGGAGAWQSLRLPGAGRFNGFTGIACPTTGFCIASAAGYFATTTNPTGGAAAWGVETAPGADYVSGIACASTSLCVAISGHELLVSANPTSPDIGGVLSLILLLRRGE
jgi:hypothetical protein